MYGLVDYHIVQEITKLMDEGKDKPMDPINLNRIAHIRQQEMLDEAAKDQAGITLRPALHQLGNLLITIGQKMRTTSNGDRYPSQENEACA